MAVKLPIIIRLYMISQFLKHHWNAEGISFPMMYHTVLYTLYSACASLFNNIPILVTMVTHIFPPKWFPWQPKSCDLSMISLLTRMPNMVKIGLKLAKLQLQNIVCKNSMKHLKQLKTQMFQLVHFVSIVSIVPKWRRRLGEISARRWGKKFSTFWVRGEKRGKRGAREGQERQQK